MNEFIVVNFEHERPTVLGRELHAGLEIKTAYKDWFPRMCEYGFTEGIDFCSILSESTGGRPSTDHQITIEMAKEICMIQRSEKGKKFRQYFLQLEKDWNTPEQVMARALKIADRQIEDLKHSNHLLEQKIEADKPKTLFADAVSASHTSILVGDLAKLLKQNGVDIGQKRLFEWLREEGYLIRQKGSSWNMPTQRSMDMKLFEIKETTITHSDGHISISKTVKITGKGQMYFISKFLS